MRSESPDSASKPSTRIARLTVPKYHSARLPSKSSLEVGSLLDVTIEQLKNGVRLFLLQTDDLAAELSIDE